MVLIGTEGRRRQDGALGSSSTVLKHQEMPNVDIPP